MRLNSDAYFENIQQAELYERVSFLGEVNLDENINDMKERLKEYERSRHFVVWHDALLQLIMDTSFLMFMLCMTQLYFIYLRNIIN